MAMVLVNGFILQGLNSWIYQCLHNFINNLYHGEEWNKVIYYHEVRWAQVMLNRVISQITVV